MATKISVQSLTPTDKEGFLTKQGGKYKNWKKRWFILKGDTIYYFKTVKDNEQTGEIKLDGRCSATMDPPKKGKFYFSIKTPTRTYFIFSDKEDIAKEWVDSISSAIANLNKPSEPVSPRKNNENNTTTTNTPPTEQDNVPNHPDIAPVPTNNTQTEENRDRNVGDAASTSSNSSSNETKLNAAKDVIPFLKNEEGKVLEFWLIWAESIPTQNEHPGVSMDYHIATSANLQKLTWRTFGPQNAFIQKMVDFFYNVGAPDTEIDRLNDIGSLINPLKIGSWIDMSANGGMDGGWFFPVDISIKMALEASDEGEPVRKVAEWASQNGIEYAFSVGRDMGASPPRQTEIRLKLPGSDPNSQLDCGLSAFSFFNFPPLPENTMPIIRDSISNVKSPLCLSIVTSSEGFVRLGLLIPSPSADNVKSLCNIAGANHSDIFQLQSAVSASTPNYVEYQFLKEGFGYGVYKEGFDVVFHYFIGNTGVY